VKRRTLRPPRTILLPEATRQGLRSLDRNEDLLVASVYSREVGASLERVWENVYDWEHLPWVHSEAFKSIDLIDSGDWGWFARIGLPGDAEIELELITDRSERRYVSRTLRGAGAPSEIWTTLTPVGGDNTRIQVEFCVTPRSEEALREIGEGYVGLYTLLWSQDEDMMQTRASALAGARGRVDLEAGPQSLGPLEALRAELPTVVEWGGDRFRIVEDAGELIVHSVECPHLRGPLDQSTVSAGRIVCPWHGYEFDARAGKSCDGRGLHLRPAPKIEWGGEADDVILRSA
jgi:nitrite reductase/ring-hydroxylating ferredoxin subunit